MTHKINTREVFSYSLQANAKESDDALKDTVEREDAGEHFCWNSWHMSGIERKYISRGFAYYSPIRYRVIFRMEQVMVNLKADIVMNISKRLLPIQAGVMNMCMVPGRDCIKNL